MATTDRPLEKGLISVIMGNYNTEPKYLREAIDSVLAQTYENFELIIVDDCSTDDSPNVLKEYTDPRIKVLHNEQNRGLPYCLNRALEICRGEYVARMDTDDVCYPERFERQLAFMRKYPDVMLAGSYVRFLVDDSETPACDWKMEIVNDPEAYRIYLLFSNFPMIVHPTWMMNHKMLLENGVRYNEKYKYSQDYAMLVSCANCGKCWIMKDFLLKRRRHAGMVSAQHKAQQEAYDYEIIQEQLDKLHLVLPEELKTMHHRFLANRKPMSFKMLRWLFTIFRANRKYHVYNQRKLVTITLARWVRTVGYSLLKKV